MSKGSTVEFEFRLPDLGEGLTEAVIEERFVQEGDEIEEGMPLFEVETDKAIVEIPAPCSGTVKEISVEIGELKNVGEILATIETDDPPRQVVDQGNPVTAEQGKKTEIEPERAETDTATRERVERESESATGSQPDDEAAVGAAKVNSSEKEKTAETNERVFAAPSTRRYAAERGVNLSDVDGSGSSGRITCSDIDGHIEAQADNETKPASTESSLTAQPESEESLQGAYEGPVTRKQFTGLRRTIADNITRSWNEIPHVSSGYSVPAEKYVEFKNKINEDHVVNITYTALMIKAVVPALKEYPMVNAEIDEANNEIIEKKYYNIGVATDTEAGLIVPVIKAADQKSLLEIAKELNEIVKETRNNSISSEKLRGSTFTITNTGSHSDLSSNTRRTFGTPIINQSEVGILGMNRIRNEVVPVNNEKVGVQKRLPLTFAYDHRLIDGITAGEFMNMVTSLIEDPDLLLLHI